MAVKYEKGLYEVEITDQRFGESKNKGTPYFEVDFKPVAKFSASFSDKTEVEAGNRNVQVYITDGKGLDIALSRLKALGVEGSFSAYDPTNPSHTSLKGRRVKMWCKGQNPAGYDEWEVFVPSNKERKPRESNSQAAAKLDNLFGNKLGGTPPAPSVDVANAPLMF
jgi:hypothetical protein